MISFYSLALISMMINLAHSICFVKTTTTEPVIGFVQHRFDTRRLCENACSAINECISFSFVNLNGMLCILQKAPGRKLCGTNLTVYAKRTSDCPTNPDIEDGQGEDPCATLLPGVIRVGNSPVCPRSSSYPKYLVIRAINLNGVRMTIDNDIQNSINFDPITYSWKFFYYNSRTNYTLYLAAASCAVADGSLCPCKPLPMTTTPIGIPVNADGVCPNDMSLYMYRATMPSQGIAERDRPFPRCKVICQAGIWVFTWVNNNYGWQIDNGTCASPGAPLG